MKYKLLGKSGLRVSSLCLGAMTFGEEWGSFGASEDESRKIYDAFLAAGGNFIDTANKYTEGTSERFLGKFMGSDRGRIVLATKYTLTMDPADPNASGNHRKNLVQSLEASLRRLQTDYVDLLWVHAWDFLTPACEVMRALDDVVRAGKVLYIGISDTPAWVVSRANTMAELMGWTSFTGIQVQYSLVERTSERELLPMARELDVGVTAWAPLGGGVLTGKYKKEEPGPKRFGPHNPMSEQFLGDRNLAIADEVEKIARQVGRSSAQVALNWIRGQKGKGVLIPILGARTEGQVKDNLGCLDFELPPEHLERLDEVSRVPLGFPHDFLNRENVRHLVFGDRRGDIEDHRERTP